MEEYSKTLKLTGVKELVVISGISGCGKTTLAKKLAARHNIYLLSVDVCKAELGTQYGFLTDFEKKIFNNTAEEHFKLQCITQMRTQESVIVEYPFSSDWQAFFTECAKSYGYRLIVINLVSKDFKRVYNARVERDKQTDRPKVLLCDAWIPNKVCHYADDADVMDHMYAQWSYQSKTRLAGDETYCVNCEDELWNHQDSTAL